LYDPRGAAFDPATGEFFVGNYEGGTGGSISRFWVDAAGNYKPDGTITGNGLDVVSQIAFFNGELFATDFHTGTISRFEFDAQGNAIPNGTINVGAPYLEGLAFSPSGELFASTISSSEIFRYRIDPGTGEATPNGTIANPGSADLHHLAFSPNGDLFIASLSDNRVYRFSFDGGGNAVLDGSISVDHPVGLAISPSGELLVTTHGDGIGKITGFSPGADGNYAYNWSIPSDAYSDSLVAVAIEAIPHLVVTAQPPGGVTAGSGFGLTVTAEDSSGNLDSSFNGTVTVALASDPGGATLGGTLTATASQGVASFSGLTLTKAASGYMLQVSSSGVSGATTSAFTITSAAASKLVIQTQPSATATAGQPFAPQPVIAEEDQYGNLETDDSSSVVTAALNSGVGPLQGTTTATVSGGVATFAGLFDNKAEAISLAFTSGSLTSATSSNIVVSPARATQLVIRTQPSAAATAGQAFGTQPVVYVVDQFGNLETGNNSTVVTATLNSGTGPLQGTTTATVSGGVAAFTNLADNAAESISLKFTSGGLTQVTTTPIKVASTPPPTIIGEQILAARKTNKKGKPVGKPVFVGFALDFSAAMNPTTAGLAANYQVDSAVTKRVNRKNVTLLQPVNFTVAYNPSTHVVALTMQGKPKFTKGGQIRVIATPPNGVSSASGVALGANDTVFTILPKARGIVPLT
jgi:hypothetical protein